MTDSPLNCISFLNEISILCSMFNYRLNMFNLLNICPRIQMQINKSYMESSNPFSFFFKQNLMRPAVNVDNCQPGLPGLRLGAPPAAPRQPSPAAGQAVSTRQQWHIHAQNKSITYWFCCRTLFLHQLFGSHSPGKFFLNCSCSHPQAGP